MQLLILLGLGHNNEVLDPNTKQVKLCTERLLYVTVGAIIYQTNVVYRIRATAPQVCQHLRHHTQCCVVLSLHRAKLYVHRCAMLTWVTGSEKLYLLKIWGELKAGQLSQQSGGLRAGRPGFDYREGQENFLFSIASRPALRPAHLKSKGYWGSFLEDKAFRAWCSPLISI